MEHCGQERQACVCRESSKLHEENKKGTLSELTLYYTKGGGIPKGEIVIVVEGMEEIKKKSSKYDLEA